MTSQTIAWIIGTALFAATSTAYARPDTRSMSCEETQHLIQSHHSAVLTTGRNTYDRYVRQYGNECDWPEVPVAASVPTRDGQCRVYWCREPVFDFPN
ncbi:MULTISPECIES: hypothetical protein [unclassified Mesorhizobium]|uniref:hypothetical protein n=1 Tax=unclassified Mesorhizobium TaxID=325217 RepID=UPI0003D048DC|nr:MULTISPECIES: hypothetical protein [unclassified Mesorhizobium]ESZ31655.1 hypothetical protein X732_30075 [Mesorhizobium sp. L2C066B000]ESZ35863.1 hypothetical protein X733_04240 [Mesorhizobium sp. L2C067A000]